MLPPAKNGQDGAPGPAGRDGIDGKDGQDGKDGRDGLPGVPGPQGEKGLDGRDGLNGKDGVPGLNGKDGTTFQEFGFTIDDDIGPIVHLKSSDGALEARFPGMWDAGVWRAGKHYPRGAGVSWNGSTWIAQKDTRGEKPGDGSGVWRLAVKAGRDAKPPREGS
jgi:integrin beta 3